MIKSMHDLEFPSGHSDYIMLIDTMISIAARCSLTVRDFDRNNEAIGKKLQNLKPYEISVSSVSEWPGTKLLFGGTAQLHLYKNSADLGYLLKVMVSSVFDWITPEFPEDLCFYRDDGSFIFGSVSHDKDAFLNVSDDELKTLRGLGFVT